MHFVKDVDKKKYQDFTSSHPKAHFLESYEWGQFCEKVKGQIAHYVGMEDDNDNLVATALLMEKKTPLFGYSYEYSPRGFLIDYNNKELLKEFTTYLKDYMKENKVIYIKMDPDIKYQDIDEEANPILNGENNYELYEYLKSLGYKHGGFYKLYNGNQPRYTFRINLKRNWQDIESVFNKSFSKSIKRSNQYNLIIDNDIRVKEFFELIENNSSKDGFNPHNLKYYEIFAKELKDHMKFFNASIRPKELLKSINEEIIKEEELLKTTTKKQEDIKNKISRLKKEKESFENIDEDEVLVCSLICVYTKNRAWSLFIGNNDLGNLTFAVSRCYYEAIKDAYNNGYEFFDLFGTVGDPHTTYKNLAKLHDFKRKFGDEYIEFIGEFDLVNKPLLYKMLPILLKIYRKIRG